MIVVGPQLPLLYPLVDPNQQVPGDVLAIIHTWGGGGEGSGDYSWSLGGLREERSRVMVFSAGSDTELHTLFFRVDSQEKEAFICY